MKARNIRIPAPILDDAREIADEKGKNPSQVLRMAMAIGLMELKGSPKDEPEKETDNDR